MKYFIYISTLKVNMLFDQIPSQIKKRIAAELKIDLGVFSTTLKTLIDSDTTISKLQLVLKHLEQIDEIGDLWTPKEYFAGTMNMDWGTVRFPREFEESSVNDIVRFGGTIDKIRVCLVGSNAHMLGETGKPVHASYSRPDFIRKIVSDVRDASVEKFEASYSARDLLANIDSSINDRQSVEFVAKTYLVEDEKHGAIRLGSPLFVASAKTDMLKAIFS